MPEKQRDDLMAESYEDWDLNPPELPARSVLCRIGPLGIGRAETECLTSYLARLATAHCLSIRSLLTQYLIPVINLGRGGSSRPSINFYTLTKMRSANGADTFAQDLVETIERSALLTGLAPTTFLWWAEVIPRRELLRDFRAWCAACYAEQAATGSQRYDLLMWAVVDVKICPRHRRPLIENCLACKRRIQPVLANYLPGFCPYCRADLSTMERASRSISNLEYELWAGDNIGQVIAATPALEARPARQNVLATVKHCCDLVAEGNSRLLARLLDAPDTTIRHWLQGTTLPSLKILVRLSYATGVSLLKLLTDPLGVLEQISKHPVEIGGHTMKPIRSLHRQNALSCQKVREQMEAALAESPPPSLAEVARRLGYRHPSTLRVKFPGLSREITTNYRVSEEGRNNRRSKCAALARGRRLDKESQRKLVEQELEKSDPLTVRDLARKLGYADTCALSVRFPELSRALVKKRKQFKQRQLEERLSRCRDLLEAALKEYPPPAMSAVARRLPEIGTSFFSEHLAPECRLISRRYADYQRERMLEAGDRLQQSLQEIPPRSLNQLSKEIGYCISALTRNYPELSHSIMARYENYRHDLRRKGK